MSETQTVTTGQFDFAPINALTRNLKTGMKLVIAESLIKDALYSMEKFKNPLVPDLQGLGEELRTFRIKYKEESAQAAHAAASATETE